MKVDWNGLVEGIRNRVLPPEELKELIESTREERLAICRECEWFGVYKCNKCGCNLQLKTSCLSCNCPVGKWIQKITRDDDKLVKEKLNGNSNS
jgi:hypothetical protein